MDISNIIILSLIVSAFVLFMAVLAYGDYATRQAQRARENKVQSAAQETSKTVQQREAA